jgi:hypothetical protein
MMFRKLRDHEESVTIIYQLRQDQHRIDQCSAGYANHRELWYRADPRDVWLRGVVAEH